MSDAFHLGGWGMIPTTIAGFVLIAAAARYAFVPDPQRARIVRALALLVSLTSCLGFVTGVIKSLLHAGEAAPHELWPFVVVGIGEALHNIGLGLALLVLATIAGAIGAYRAGPAQRSGGAVLTDPHGG